MDNLLTLARADEGRATLAVKPHDLRELVSEAAETAGILGEGPGITVRTEVPDNPVLLPVDYGRMRQLILNLVTNAIKYTPPGGKVSLGLVDQGDTVALVVGDNGIGISATDLPISSTASTAPILLVPGPETVRVRAWPLHYQVDRRGPRRNDWRAESYRAGDRLHGHIAPAKRVSRSPNRSRSPGSVKPSFLKATPNPVVKVLSSSGLAGCNNREIRLLPLTRRGLCSKT